MSEENRWRSVRSECLNDLRGKNIKFKNLVKCVCYQNRALAGGAVSKWLQ